MSSEAAEVMADDVEPRPFRFELPAGLMELANEDPGPRTCRWPECDVQLHPRQVGDRFLEVEICEKHRLMEVDHAEARRRAREAEEHPEVLARRGARLLPEKYQHLDLGRAEWTDEPPSPALGARALATGRMQLPFAVRSPAGLLKRWTPAEPGHPPRGFLLHGPTGNGKSGLLAGAFVHAWRRGLRGFWLSERTYIAALRAQMDDKSVKAPTLGQIFNDRDFVVIDDLGVTDNATEWHHDRMEDLVCHAYDKRVALWASTNRDPDDLKTRAGLKRAVGARSFDRLEETTTTLEVAGGSWRREG